MVVVHLTFLKMCNSHFGTPIEIHIVAGFKHTGPIENVNSLHNKYMPKLQFFSHEGALTRTALTAIGINHACK